MADPTPVNGVNVVPPVSPPARQPGIPFTVPSTTQFRDVLRDASSATSTGMPLKFSAHAMQRLESRNIKLTTDDVARLNAMADKAAAKGAKQSLFMLNDVALVVSIKNRTVITAIDRDSRSTSGYNRFIDEGS